MDAITSHNIKARQLQREQKHIKELQALGYIYSSLKALRTIEHKANYIATLECNGEITEEDAENEMILIERAVYRLFGGNMPKGFFINGDPRGYALKIDPEAWKVSDDPRENYEALPIKYQDWGSYMILAPERGNF